MSRINLILILVLGLLLMLGGGLDLNNASGIISNCFHLPTPSTCGPNPVGIVFDAYAFATVGLVLVVFSLMMHWHQRRNREDSQHP